MAKSPRTKATSSAPATPYASPTSARLTRSRTMPTPRGRSYSSPTSTSPGGITELKKVNENAISDLLHRLVPSATFPSIDCGHGKTKPKLCMGRTPGSHENMGRWYTYCTACKNREWLSNKLHLPSLLESNEEFNLLLSIRESLKPRRRRVDVSPSPALVPSNIQFIIWLENFDWAASMEVPRPSGGAFCLNDYKIVLGEHGVERGNSIEVYHPGSRSWAPIEWDKFIYPGSAPHLFFRIQGVTCMPDFSTLSLMD
ncbi:hypothetical protein NP233_g10083 [Leucocoprinus birnbaumii]|uniref:Uncharacterized protein n=1 Tax=Leucocoprinus birnbaumii TaxID=56174 RepID=A0AAD5VJ78_9AGAR|nr:hypothetical protein NP233_g10083 [Leucocoprinus birnbaumii]